METIVFGTCFCVFIGNDRGDLSDDIQKIQNGICRSDGSVSSSRNPDIFVHGRNNFCLVLEFSYAITLS
jgi:hypothetical protein